MTPEVKKRALTLISNTTKSIKNICRLLKVNPDTFYQALADDEVFSDHYVRAKEKQATLFFEELIEISRRKSKDSVAAMDKRLEIDTVKWALAKTLPKKYGEKIVSENTNNNININSVPLSKEETRKIAKDLEDEY